MRRISKVFSPLLLALVVGSLSAQAQTFTFKKLTYRVRAGLPAEVEVIKSQAMTTSITIPETVENGGKTYTVTKVTRVGDGNLTILRFPNTIREIGDGAISGYFDSGKKLPEKLEILGSKAFRGGSIAGGNVTIPATVKSIGVAPFLADFAPNNQTRIRSVESITVNSKNTKYKSIDGVLFTKNGRRLIQYPGRKGGKMGTYTLPSSTRTVGELAFAYTQLKTITLNEGLTTIENHAFYNTKYLVELRLPSTVTTLRSGTFSFSNIQKLHLGKGITSLESDILENCKFLKTLTVDKGNPNYTTRDGVLYDKAITHLFFYPRLKEDTKFEIPSTVKRIDRGAFRNNKLIEDVTFPEGVKEIPKNCFAECEKLRTVTLPEGLTTLGERAFFDCNSIKSLTIPASIKTIRRQIGFHNCTDLTILSRQPDKINVREDSNPISSTFHPDKVANCTLHVPAGQGDAYRKLAWAKEFKKIVELPAIEVSSISLNKTSLKLGVGNDETLIATILPSNATNQTLKWDSDDPNVATVSKDGAVHGVAKGICTITVTTHNSKSVTCKVNVGDFVPVTKVTLNKKNIELTETVTCSGLVATVEPKNATDPTITWVSSAPSIATIDPKTGVIKPIAPGVLTFTAKAGNKSATCSALVKAYIPLDGLTISHTELRMDKNDEQQLSVSFNPSDATNQNVSWESDNNAVATVEEGRVKAVGYGMATITASTQENSYKAKCSVTVGTQVEGISLNMTKKTLKIGEGVELTASVTPPEAANKNIAWNTSNSAVATINAAGNTCTVTATGAGGCRISATTQDGGLETFCDITVTGSIIATTIEFWGEKHTLQPGDVWPIKIYKLEPKGASLVWASDNTAVATVNQNGEVKAIAGGVAHITASAIDGSVSATYTVTVTGPDAKPVTGVTLAPESKEIALYEEFTLTATIAPSDASNHMLTWTSEMPSIATVDENGKVKGIEAGETTITVTTVDGNYSASCAVTVRPEAQPSGIALDVAEYTMEVAEHITLRATVQPASANQSVSWASSDTNIATVSNTGEVTAIAAGVCDITATTANGGYSATCKLTVKEPGEHVGPSTPVEDSPYEQVTISPNPAYEYISIRGVSVATAIRVYNLEGVLMRTETVMPNARIDIRNLKAGIYILHVNAQSIRFAKK